MKDGSVEVLDSKVSTAEFARGQPRPFSGVQRSFQKIQLDGSVMYVIGEIVEKHRFSKQALVGGGDAGRGRGADNIEFVEQGSLVAAKSDPVKVSKHSIVHGNGARSAPG